jgi:hypothetical protein
MFINAYRNRKSFAALALLLTLISAVAPVAMAQSWHTVRVENQSHYDVHKMYLSPASSRSWGPDLLGRYTLDSGFVFNTPAMPDGRYDLKLVDEDGDVCVVGGLAIYGNTNWQITDRWLLNCEFR